MVGHMCQPIWDRFNDQAATAGVDQFPSMTEILDERRKEQPQLSGRLPPGNGSIRRVSKGIRCGVDVVPVHLSARTRATRQELAERVLSAGQRRKVETQLGLVTTDMANIENAQAEAQQMAATGAAAAGDTTAQQPAGEMSDMSRLQWGRNRKAIEDILAELIAGTASETKARVFLQRSD
jgi:hypothetical protein